MKEYALSGESMLLLLLLIYFSHIKEYALSGEYMARLNVEFAKLGVQGVSLLFAAGDDGVGMCARV